IIELSKIHFIELCTNLFWEPEPVIRYINPKYIKIGTSFHPEFANLDDFLRKLKLLKNAGFDVMVNFVPWPPLLPDMQYYKERIEEEKIQFVLQPFIGTYQGRHYPLGYTDEEKKFFRIFKDDCNINTLSFKTDNTEKKSNTKGKLCRMGQNYGFIHPDGSVSRCCRDHSLSLGNIIDKTFKLLEEPLPCQVEECNCWRFMEVGREKTWLSHWQSPDIERVYLHDKKV
ncbi:MAG: hypothetical protein NC900_06670, partial [Candidatus Omnitrophica bacterium]|nr:hypothetical protein [Candidatus Omnitrophota bacterium]